MKNNKNTKQGIIKYIFLIIAALILIAYFKDSIFGFLGTPAVKNALVIAIGWIQQALIWLIAKLGWTSSQISS